MAIKLYKGDLPAGLDFGSSVAIDSETLGLIPRRDKLCVVQLSPATATPISSRSTAPATTRRTSRR
jgi:ribonuclease D